MTGAPTSRGRNGQAQRDDYQDAEKQKLLLQRAIDDAAMNTARLERDRQDLFNLLFYRGGEDCQWIVWNGSNYVPRPYDGPDGIPAWVPRCVTNKYAKKIDGVVAILNQSSPAKTFVPKTDDDSDLATAEVCEDADPVLLDEIGYTRLRGRIHQLIAMTDKVAVVYYYDNDPKHGTAPIELMQCVDCQEIMTPLETGGSSIVEGDASDDAPTPDNDIPAAASCPYCGSENVTIAVDPSNGIAMHVEYPTGKICADLWTSYEFSLPSTATVADPDFNPWVLGHRQMPIEDACRHWPDHADIIRAGGSQRMAGAALTAQYAATVRTLSSPRAAQGAGWGGSAEAERGTVTVYRLIHDPIEDDKVSFPDGLYAVQVGETIVESGPLPIKDARGRRRKNVLIRQYGDVPMTPFGKPVADDLSFLQKTRNRNESLLEMILLHHAAPTTYLPEGVELIDQLTATPGAIHRFRSLHPGQHPIVEHGVNPPEGLYKRLEMIDADMDELSGLNAVLQGERPEGDPTLGEVQRLQENGMAAFRTPLDHLIDFERRQSLMLLDLARETAWFPRYRQIEGENGQWNVSQFAAADLSGEVDVTIEPLSAWPKSPSMQMTKLGKGVELGVVQPPADPEVATKILSMLDLTELKPSLDADRKQIARELDRWKAARVPQDILPPDLAIIEVPIHLHLKKQFLKTEEVEQLKMQNPAVWQAMVMHVQMLQMALMPPPMPDPNAKPAGPDGSAVAGAVNAGAIVPAGAVPPPQAPPGLDAAVGAGALVPAAAMGAGQPQGPSIDELMEQQILSPAPPPAAPAR